MAELTLLPCSDKRGTRLLNPIVAQESILHAPALITALPTVSSLQSI